jgi:hypothetical protein
LKYWEIIADNLSNVGWSLGLRLSVGFQRASDLDCGRASRYGKRFVVRAD